MLFKKYLEEAADPLVKLNKKKAALEKKIESKKDALSFARERRKMKGQRLQGDREIKLSSEISSLGQELHMINVEIKKLDPEKVEYLYLK